MGRKRKSATMKQVKNYIWNREKYLLEPKHHDLASSLTPDANAVPGAANIINLQEIAQGSTELTRNGLEVQMNSWRLNIQIKPGANQLLRIMVLVPKKGFQNLSGFSDVQAVPATSFTTDLLEYGDKSKWASLYDRLIQCDDADDTKIISIGRKFKRARKLEFTGTANSTAVRPLYLVIYTNQSSSGLPVVSYQFRMWFRDPGSSTAT